MRALTKVSFGLMTFGLLALLAGSQLAAGEKKDKAKGKAMTVKVGDKAPAFESVDENGKAWKSSDHVGKKTVVLFFFPAALTGG